MRVNRGLLGWGVFFIVLGAVPLAVRGGAIDPALLRRAWELWPLILVGIGLGLVLERTPLAVVGGLLVSVTFGLMGGAILAGGVDSPLGLTTCGFDGDDRGEPFAEQRGTLDGGGQMTLELSCGTLDGRAGPGTDWVVSGRSHDGMPPETTTAGGEVTVRSPERDGAGFLAEGEAWVVQLPRDVALGLRLAVNAGSADLDLAGLRIADLAVDVNAGDVEVRLGEGSVGSVSASVNAGSLDLALPRPVGSLRGSLSVNAGSLDVCIPEGSAMRFEVGDSPLGSDNFDDHGLVRRGDTWTTPGYDAASDRLELDVSVNLGSIRLNPEDGCD